MMVNLLLHRLRQRRKRIKETNQPAATVHFLNTFDDYQFHELDLINIAKLGEQWFGESFDIKQDQNLEFNFQT
jgi:hypothetical protein